MLASPMKTPRRWPISLPGPKSGGSDAHAIASVGCAYTVVPHARRKQEYLDGLRRGLGRVRGETGGYFKLTRDVLTIAGQHGA